MNFRLYSFHWQVRKRVLSLIILGLLLLMGTVIYIQELRTYPVVMDREPVRYEISDERVADVEGYRHHEMVLRARRPGNATVRAYYPSGDRENVREIPVHVSEDLRISLGPGQFAGDRAIIFSVTVMFFAITAVSLYTSIEAHIKKVFSYAMAAADTMSIMLCFQSFILLSAVIGSGDRSLSGFFATIHTLGTRFTEYTAPLMAGLAIWLFISNIWLLHKEGVSRRNMLGIALGLLWTSAYLLHLLLAAQSTSVLIVILQTIVDYTIVYFECVLLALAFCGVRAAGHKPAFGKDCIVILGCQLRKNGTLTPLLQGRVDRALAFEKEQYIQTGRHAYFMPSGGQGKGEVTSEAHAMSLYLQEKGVPEKWIFEENKSRNTLQNMAYSKRLLESIMPGAKAAFSTTGYHVFRAMLLATRSDFDAEGMGSRTKWYYYPNAYLREILGLVYAHQFILWCLFLILGIYLTFGLLAQVS